MTRRPEKDRAGLAFVVLVLAVLLWCGVLLWAAATDGIGVVL